MLVAAIRDGARIRGDGGVIRCAPGASFVAIAGDAPDGEMPVRRLATSSNSVSLLGDRLFLKGYRRLQAGVNPELEMGRFLTDVVGFEHCVPVAGSVAFEADDGRTYTLAVLQAQVTHQGDAWSLAVDQLSSVLGTQGAPGDRPHDDAGAMVERMRLLARRVAQLHVALARRTGDPAFDPEPVTAEDLVRWVRAVDAERVATFERLARRRADLPEPLAADATRLLELAPRLEAIGERVAGLAPAGVKTRLHGDLHLGQVLIRRNDVLLIDFEGEPHRPIEERRVKHSALRDVAGLLRSFDYVRHESLRRMAQTAPDLERFVPVARSWQERVAHGFLDEYRGAAVKGGLYADAAAFDATQPLLELFVLEKALYELRYEMDNRPEWIGVPLAGLAALAASA